MSERQTKGGNQENYQNWTTFVFMSMLKSHSLTLTLFHAIFAYKQWLLCIDMKTKVVQHVESEWMREWKSESETLREWESVRMRECESERVTFEHRHENKSCSVWREWVNERVRDCETVREWENERVREWPGSQLLSDVQTFFSCECYLTLRVCNS